MRQSVRKKSIYCKGVLHPVDDGSLDLGPFALVLNEAHGMRISALNQKARQCGLYDGMRLSDARALLPSLATKIAKPETDMRALSKLASWCQRYTPMVSVDGANGLWLDITGAEHFYGGEEGLLADLKQRLSTLGFENKLGLAETAGAASAIARFANANGMRVIPAGHLLQALTPLPLEALRLNEKALYLLKRFGLKTIGSLHDIPRSSLKRRFPSKEVCEAVLHRLDQIFGRVPEPITPLKAAPVYVERQSFAEPVLATESFRLSLHDLLERLTKQMEQDGKGVTRLAFTAYHADGGLSHIAIATARPSRDAGHLAHLFRDKIETINPGFGVDVVALSANSVEPLAVEQIALSQNNLAQGDVDQLIDRLSNRLGAHNVQRIAFRESHVPERVEQRVSASQERMHEVSNSSAKPLRPSRLLTRPEPIQVMAEVPEGPPIHFAWRRVRHRVMRAEGPERIAPEWWQINRETTRGQQRTRDYYRVEDDQGRRFWLFREGLYRNADKGAPPTWYMHGLFA